jgi:ApaG protein
MSDTTTNGVRIQVQSEFEPAQSDPSQQQFFFSYHVRISNVGDVPVKLISRHWVITDAFGEIQHVRGLGVVGEQPRLEPGRSFEYSSACPLGTPHGSMHGTYQMITDEGVAFNAEIEQFRLGRPENQS